MLPDLIVPSFSQICFAFHNQPIRLSLSAPDALDEAVTLGQAVQGIVGLAHGTDETAESVDVVLAGDGAAGLVNLGDGDLDGTVVLGLDDTVGGRALAGDVAVREVGGLAQSSLLSFPSWFCRPSSPFQMQFKTSYGVLTDRRSHHGRFPFWRLGLGDCLGTVEKVGCDGQEVVQSVSKRRCLVLL